MRGRQPARYLVSGAFCAIANNGLLVAGADAGLSVLELTFLSFLVIGSAGYLAHVYFTFQQAASWRSYARFMAGVAFGIPIAYAILSLLCDGLRMPMVFAAPIATMVLLIYNFISARLAIMRRLFR